MSARKDSARPDPVETALMKRALALARKALGDTGHYPMVGAVVAKKGRKISEGHFKRPGAPHAEIVALNKAGRRARGADLVLNLEPCSHHGRTPPCASAVIEAGIKRVVAGMRDPNPLVSGRGFEMLRRAGIEVVEGVLEKECLELNRVFSKFITTRTPYVVMKAASTLDGKIAAASGDSKWITGEDARIEVHKMRDIYQAVMVGAGTVNKDDCELTVRLAGKGRHPRPVVLTDELNIPLKARVMRTPCQKGPLLFCTKKTDPARIKRFEKAGAEVVKVKSGRGGGCDMGAVMEELGAREVASVLLEGGSRLFGSALRAGVVDEVVMFMAPRMMAGDGVSVTSGKGPDKMKDALKLTLVQTKRVGADLMVRARTAEAQG